jgi:PKHD-type hydroxylase
MILTLPGVLTPDQASSFRRELGDAPWTDGRITARYQSQQVKQNRQLNERHPLARRLGDIILETLERHPVFMSAALPLKVVPPLFNLYAGGETYGDHIDGAIRPIGGARVRTDLSATLFLADPDSYDGGELVIEAEGEARRVKLPAGDMVLYPGTSIHRVEPVTRGARLASFFWIQSMVRDDGRRTILYDLDSSIQACALAGSPDQATISRLTKVYHNLLRQWAEL